MHEADNPWDDQALVFECFHYNKWNVIGYVVREALDSVHEALEEKRLLLH